jgi:hypothetical protein
VKALQALVMSLAAVPVYLWARPLAGRGWALAAAALLLALPALAYSGLLMTEVEFLPVAGLAAWALSRALARPTPAAQALALGAVLLAAATRLQALVLGPALVTAILLHAWLERDVRRALRLWPLVGGLAAIGVVWAGYTLSSGGPATDVLGAYRAAGEVGYSAGEIAKYALWHAADVVLLVGVVPACALAVLLARHEGPAELRATVAVTASLALWLSFEVGVFASRHVGRLAERDLIACAPGFFVCFAVWCARAARRSLAVAVAAVALVATLPLGRLVSQAAIPDAFTLIPLWRLQVHFPHVSLRLVGVLVAAAAAAAFVALPRRALAAGLFLALAAVSVSAGRVVAGQASISALITTGHEPRWIDSRASGPVSYVFSDEASWVNAWQSIFWNRRVDRVYDMPNVTRPIDGPLPQTPTGPRADGSLVVALGRADRRIVAPYAVAADSLRFAGERIGHVVTASVSLWRLEQPPRLESWTQGVGFDRRVASGHVAVFVYACRGGSLALDLRASELRRVTVKLNGRVARRVRLGAGAGWTGALSLRPPGPPGRSVCSVNVDADGAFSAPRVQILPPT